MTLEPTKVDMAKIIDEWAGAHEMLSRSGVPTGPADQPVVAWSLPSRIRWLTEQREHTERLGDQLRHILDDYDIRRRSKVR